MRKLLVKWGRFGVLAALVLSGCFRPAGDSIEPTSDATAQSFSQSIPTDTPGAPPVTLLSPNTPIASATPSAPALTEVTVIPFQDTATSTPQVGPATPTLQIITPGIALQIVTPDTATPIPLETEAVTAPAIMAPATEQPLAPGETATAVPPQCQYTVQPGDTLYQIALRNNTSVNALVNANPDMGGSGAVLQIGEELVLPNCTVGVTPTPKETVIGIDNSVPLPGEDTYTVQPGDTLGAIASQYGVSVNAIMQANNLTDPNQLSIGEHLVIPIRQSGQ